MMRVLLFVMQVTIFTIVDSKKGCRHGNKAGWCSAIGSKFPISRCYGNEKRCCSTCRALKLDIPDCPYGDRGKWCQGIGTRYLVASCYKDEKTCCATCHRLKQHDIPGCAYGNGATWCPGIGKHYPLSQCEKHRQLCCATCYDIKVRSTATTAADEIQDITRGLLLPSYNRTLTEALTTEEVIIKTLKATNVETERQRTLAVSAATPRPFATSTLRALAAGRVNVASNKTAAVKIIHVDSTVLPNPVEKKGNIVKNNQPVHTSLRTPPQKYTTKPTPPSQFPPGKSPTSHTLPSKPVRKRKRPRRKTTTTSPITIQLDPDDIAHDMEQMFGESRCSSIRAQSLWICLWTAAFLLCCHR